MKKTLSFVLVLAMLFPVFAGCGGGKVPAQTTEPTAATTTADTTAATTTPIPPRDPAYNVGEIRIGDVSITEYKIVLPEDPAEAEQYAAEELIKYIELATGKTLEIAESADKAIYIGGYPDAAHIDDGFDIKVVDGDLIISGSIPRGTLYGVYTFLEEYIGWRWFDPECIVVHVNDFIQIPVDLNDRQNPIFTSRAGRWMNMKADRDFASKNKINANRDARPIDDDYLGGLYGTVFTGHTFSRLVSPQKYYAEHPEWFTEHSELDKGNYGASQICLTNPEVLEVAIASLREILAANPTAKYVGVGQNDNQSYCICEDCYRIDELEGSHAGSLLRFVNAIAEDIEKDYPDVIIQTFAYQYTRTPPQITVPRENVQIMLCPIECCFYHALDDDSCRVNRSFMKDFAGWSEICDNIAIFDYSNNFDEYCTFYPNFDSLREDARVYAEHGVKNMFTDCQYTVSGELGELRSYLISKLYWDPYMTEEEYQYHMDDFLKGYYGEGWEAVRYYIDTAMQRVEEEGLHVTCFVQHGYVGLTADDIAEIKTRFAAAAELATDAQKDRLERTYISVIMAERATYMYYGYDKQNIEKALACFEEAKALAQKWGIKRSHYSTW